MRTTRGRADISRRWRGGHEYAVGRAELNRTLDPTVLWDHSGAARRRAQWCWRPRAASAALFRARVGSSGRGGDCDTPESSSSLNSEAKSKAPPSCQFSAFERKPPHRDGRQRQGAAMAMDRYERQGCYSCAGVLSALGVLLMLILLPMTWKKVEYYQGCPRRRPAVGFSRSRRRAGGRPRPPRSRRRTSRRR